MITNIKSLSKNSSRNKQRNKSRSRVIHLTFVYSSAFHFKYNSVARQIILTKGKNWTLEYSATRIYRHSSGNREHRKKKKLRLIYSVIHGKYLSSICSISAFHEIFGQKGKLDFQTNIYASINYEQCQKGITKRFSDLFIPNQNLRKKFSK
jgi:hypothetical protein